MSKKTKDYSSDYYQNYGKWRDEHVVLALLEDIRDLVIYNPISRRLSDFKLKIKWAWQRLVRGYDDSFRWSFYDANARQTLEVLKWMRKSKHGSPYTTDSQKVLKTPVGDIKSTNIDDMYWHERWDEALGLMIDGFQALLDIDDLFVVDKNGNYDMKATRKEEKKLIKKWKIGSRLFIDNYRGLWD